MIKNILIITDNKLSSQNQTNALANDLVNISKGKTKILQKTINRSYFHFFPNSVIYFFLII